MWYYEIGSTCQDKEEDLCLATSCLLKWNNIHCHLLHSTAFNQLHFPVRSLRNAHRKLTIPSMTLPAHVCKHHRYFSPSQTHTAEQTGITRCIPRLHLYYLGLSLLTHKDLCFKTRSTDIHWAGYHYCISLSKTELTLPKLAPLPDTYICNSSATTSFNTPEERVTNLQCVTRGESSRYTPPQLDVKRSVWISSPAALQVPSRPYLNICQASH